MALPLILLFCVVATAAITVTLVARARAQGSIQTRTAPCEVCGTRSPVLAVRYYQNTGMLIMRQSRHFHALACRSCSAQLFVRMTLHNLVLGWWGMISMIVTPLFILNNLGYFLASRTLPSGAALATSSLEAHREYALNLLATKDPATVVEVLSRTTGASPADVRAFVERLR
jgi:hypothetical protein